MNEVLMDRFLTTQDTIIWASYQEGF